ncbi:MAG TPA: flagellar hook-length control protein FliK, partial [Thermodesulfovibrio thiophilus]|nr:flagellar hook-length control protein FliK [Thermodesulfovibrio thiophilus]
TKELVSMNIDKNSLSLDKGFSVSLPARHETDNSTRVLQFLSDKVEALTNLQHKTDEKNFNDTLSQLNIMHNISNTAPKNPQKIELPVSNIQNLSDIVFKSVSTSQKSITIQLEPPELGKILIRISMDSSGIKADMKVDYPHIKEMITGLIPEIKSNLESRGVKVSDFLLDLTKDHPGYGDSYNGQGQQKYKGNQKFFEYFA